MDRTASEEIVFLLAEMAEGRVRWLDSGGLLTLEEACARVDLARDEIATRFGTWAVTEYGLECLCCYYPIPATRLAEPWLAHMAEKEWVGLEFLPAYLSACQYHQVALPHLDALRLSMRYTSRKEPLPQGSPKPRSSRRGLRPKVRFEIFRRDNYRCQLCGAEAGEGVRLEIDHKHPVAKGGTNEAVNLWVLCSMCNSGKSDEPL